jgi:hypothetical protein
VQQSVVADTVNVIDLTGYVKKGENQILLDFPFEKDRNGFAATLQIDYNNADKNTIDTDSSWLTKDGYTFPSYLTDNGKYKVAQVISNKEPNKSLDNIKRYNIALNLDNPSVLKGLYLDINYDGDKAEMYCSNKLIADDFNNGGPWTTNILPLFDQLKRQGCFIQISPITKNAKMYFDDEAAKNAALKATLQKISLKPEYEKIVSLSELNGKK